MKRNLLISLLVGVISVVTIVWVLSMPQVAQAATCTRTGCGVTPTLTDDIAINNTANQPIIYSGTNSSTLYTLTFDSGASLHLSGPITFDGDNTHIKSQGYNETTQTTAFYWPSLPGPSAVRTSNPVRRSGTDSSPATPLAPAEDPFGLVTGGVSDYMLAAPKLFWHTKPGCNPALVAGPAANNTNESISRVAVQGSVQRTLYSNEVNATCPQQTLSIQSNVIADADYVYWASGSSVMRLSTSANVGDAPQVLSNAVGGTSELTQDGSFVYVLSHSLGVWKINKASGASSQVWPIPGNGAINFQTDGFYLYWINFGDLEALALSNSAVSFLDSGVTGYYLVGGAEVIYAKGGVLTYYDGVDHYGYFTSPDPNVTVYSIVDDGPYLFMLQSVFIPCSPDPCFPSYQYRLVRSVSPSHLTEDVLYSTPIVGPAYARPDFLKMDDSYLFWQDQGAVNRLPKDAAALPKTNLCITGIEVTQGIQKPDNSVVLIKGRRTFVRVFVQSDGPAVPGVSMILYRVDSLGAIMDSVLPANSVGTNLTVQPSPQRSNLDDSFLFELPWDWTKSSSLNLRTVLNPYHLPLQADYSNNDRTFGPFSFVASPRLQVQFIGWGYTLNNTVYYPRIVKDVQQTYSWIRRAYPLDSSGGGSSDPSVGFRPNLWLVADDALGARVNQTDPECAGLAAVKNPDGTTSDNRDLCASAYTNRQMDAMRTEEGLPSSLFFYGMISDGGKFPRGQACCGANVSTGPAGCCNWGWDTDGSYADWYAAHEIGHTLGRQHPQTGNQSANSCKAYDKGSSTDGSFPWPNAQIGQSDTTEGFDAGEGYLNIARALYLGTQWRDVMSYCNNQWVSDYTYKAMYDYMLAHSALAASEAAPLTASSASISGDWLSLYGVIISGTNSAHIDRLRHVSSVTQIPARVPGSYSIRLLNAGNSALADYPFTPDAGGDEGPDVLNFTQIVTFATGTTQVRLVRLADGATLATAQVSAHAPSLSNVALQGAPNPVTGTVTLGWTASDADGDPLSFDVYYNRNGGTTFQPLKLNVKGNSTSLDTARLGGGSAILRVVANDGVNTAQVDSASFTIANKPPQPNILTPGSGLRIHYGQLVNFSGEAEDFQDGGVSGAGLVWSNQKGTLGSGALLSVSDLPIGTNIITLRATDSASLSANTSITVVVDDDLNLLGPTLTAGPMQFAWNFPANATQAQTATVNIGNAGSGTLNWTAGTDVTWLSLSTASGSAPASITLSANPSGIPNGSNLNGHLVISAPGTQTVTIPVNIAVGVSFDNPTGYVPSYIYLPLTLKNF